MELTSNLYELRQSYAHVDAVHSKQDAIEITLHLLFDFL